MHKKIYCEALESERSALLARDIIDQHLRTLEREGDGIWEMLKIVSRWTAYGLADCLERWIEHVELQQERHR
jgi:hypothetical protein